MCGLLRLPEDDLNLIPVFPFFHRLSMIKGLGQDQGLVLWWNRGINAMNGENPTVEDNSQGKKDSQLQDFSVLLGIME